MRNGTYYQSRFAFKVDRYGENITLVRRLEGVPCVGAFNPFTGEYDPARDREYHKSHPEAPVCHLGYLGEQIEEEEAKGFVAFSLKESEYTLYRIDELRDDEIIIFWPFTVELDGIESVVYPSPDGRVYSIRKKDDWYWDNTLIYRYSVCRLLSTADYG